MPSPENHDAPSARRRNAAKRSFANHYRGRDVLITGGLGFLGSNLAIRLVEYGAKVSIVDSLLPQGGGNWQNIATIRDKADVHVVNMRDAQPLEDLVRGKDYVFNLAGHVSHGDSMREPQLDLECNCTATLNLVEACRKHCAGMRDALQLHPPGLRASAAVAGRRRATPPFRSTSTASTSWRPSITTCCTTAVYALRSTVLRLTNTYGPRQKNRRRPSRGGRRVPPSGPPRRSPSSSMAAAPQRRDFNYVDDVVDAMLRAACHPQMPGDRYSTWVHERPIPCWNSRPILQASCDFEVRCVPFPSRREDHRYRRLLRRLFRFSQCRRLGTENRP